MCTDWIAGSVWWIEPVCVTADGVCVSVASLSDEVPEGRRLRPTIAFHSPAHMSIPCMSVIPANIPFLLFLDPPTYVSRAGLCCHATAVKFISLRTPLSIYTRQQYTHMMMKNNAPQLHRSPRWVPKLILTYVFTNNLNHKPVKW